MVHAGHTLMSKDMWQGHLVALQATKAAAANKVNLPVGSEAHIENLSGPTSQVSSCYRTCGACGVCLVVLWIGLVNCLSSC